MKFSPSVSRTRVIMFTVLVGIAGLAFMMAVHRNRPSMVMLPKEPEVSEEEVNMFLTCLGDTCSSELEGAKKELGRDFVSLLSNKSLGAAFAGDGLLPPLPKGHGTRALQYCHRTHCQRTRTCAEMGTCVT